ncbi:MAG: cytosine deaminase, partial [Roseiarcus sp.]
MTFRIAKTRRWALTDARVLLARDYGRLDGDGFARVDMMIEDGRIVAIAPAGTFDLSAAPRLAMAGRIALPLFVDAHTHLDKGQIWRRANNPSGD